LRILVLDFGSSKSGQICEQVLAHGVVACVKSDVREALNSLDSSSADALVATCAEPVTKWLTTISKFARDIPVVLLSEQEPHAGDMLRAAAAGVSVLVPSNIEASLLIDACRLAKAGYFVIRRPLDLGKPVCNKGQPMLTPRETEVLRLVSEGKTNAEIAKQLFIAEVTVRNHLSNIFKKTGFKNRTGAGMAYTLLEVLSGNRR